MDHNSIHWKTLSDFPFDRVDLRAGVSALAHVREDERTAILWERAGLRLTMAAVQRFVLAVAQPVVERVTDSLEGKVALQES